VASWCEGRDARRLRASPGRSEIGNTGGARRFWGQGSMRARPGGRTPAYGDAVGVAQGGREVEDGVKGLDVNRKSAGVSL